MLQRQKRPKSPSFIVKTPVKSIGEHRKVRELPRKMNIEVDTTAPPRQRTSVLGPDGAEDRKVGKLPRKMNISSWDGAEHRKVRKLPRKMNISSWAGCCRTPTSTKITRKHRLQFLGRMLQNTQKYENYQETSTSVLEPDVAAPKTSKKPEFYCKNTGQEHWRTPKSTRITTKNEHRRS